MPVSESKEHVLDASTKQTLENSLAMQVMKLFALIAKADTIISEEETLYVQRFLERKYPLNIARYLLDRFEEYSTGNLDVSETVSAINKQHSYQEKLFALIKTYELIVADVAADIEVITAHTIAESLQLKPSDVLYIEKIFGLSEISSSEIADSTIVKLRISGDLSNTDVYLPFSGLDIEIYNINDILCILQKDRKHDVTVNDYPLAKNTIARILHNSDITVDEYTIKYHDLHLYFENKMHLLQIDKYLSHRGDVYVFNQEETQDSIFRLTINGSLFTLTPLKKDVHIMVNDRPITQRSYVNLNDSVFVNGNHINLREIYHNLKSTKIIKLDPESQSYTITNDLKGDIPVIDDIHDDWKIELDHNDGKLIYTGGNCPYPVFINNKFVKGSKRIYTGDSFFIKNTFLHFDLDNYTVQSTEFSFKKVCAESIDYSFHDGYATLDSVSFDIYLGDLVCIMGPSGCGKSTLLNIICGLFRATHGTVFVDEHDLQQNYETIKDYIGYVPQDDLLLANLTVYENLYYYARLRFPQKTKKELDVQIILVLNDIGLIEKKNTRVGTVTNKYLSGGQRKRLNIGLELLTNADIYILDEPTSGLSSKDSEKIMRLLINIANRGKIVLTVLHQPSSKIYKMFNKVIILDKGGKLAYFGPTLQALDYFKQNMDVLSLRDTDEIECPHCKSVQPDLLLDSLEESIRDIDGTTLQERKYPPEYWKEKYRLHISHIGVINVQDDTLKMLPPPRTIKFIEQIKQFQTLFARNLKNKMRDRSNLIITFIEAPLLGFATGFVLRYSPYSENIFPIKEYTLYENAVLRVFLFTAVIVALFLGLTNSVDEIINDAPLFLRERMLNIKNWSYFASKLLVLLPFSVIQVTLFIFLGFMCLGMRELYLHYILFLSITAFAGISIGLLISAIPKLTSKAAHNIVPLILVPQIILGGALIQYERLNQQLKVFANDPIPEFCQIMPSRWAYEGLIVLQETFNSYDTEYKRVMDEFSAYKLRNKEIKEKFGEDYYNAKLYSMESDKDKFMGTHQYKYGNADIHFVVETSDHDYRQRLADSDDIDDDLSGENISRSSFFSCPMFVRKKFVPWTHREINTAYFNGIVIFLLTVTINLFTLLVLKLKKSMSFSQLLVSCAHSHLLFHRYLKKGSNCK